jgi:hypothetical protein
VILKIFSPKNSAKKLAFLAQNKAKLLKNLIKTLVFEKNANYFAENCRKSPKIMIITSTPGHPAQKQQQKVLGRKQETLERSRIEIFTSQSFLLLRNCLFYSSYLTTAVGSRS